MKKIVTKVTETEEDQPIARLVWEGVVYLLKHNKIPFWEGELLAAPPLKKANVHNIESIRRYLLACTLTKNKLGWYSPTGLRMSRFGLTAEDKERKKKLINIWENCPDIFIEIFKLEAKEYKTPVGRNKTNWRNKNREALERIFYYCWEYNPWFPFELILHNMRKIKDGE